MSYDVYFVIDTGNGHEAEINTRNYTSNVSRMWTKALQLPDRPAEGNRTYADGSPVINRGVRLLHEAPASEAAGVLAAAVERMAANPDDYTPMNPENGWGDYAGALEFLRWMADMAAAHPATTIKVSS